MSNEIDSVMTHGIGQLPANRRTSDVSGKSRDSSKEVQNLQENGQSKEHQKFSQADVLKIVDAANRILAAQSTAVRFKVDKRDGVLVTSIYNTNTNEVIREIPSREFRQISARLKEYQHATEQAGLLVDQLV